MAVAVRFPFKCVVRPHPIRPERAGGGPGGSSGAERSCAAAIRAEFGFRLANLRPEFLEIPVQPLECLLRRALSRLNTLLDKSLRKGIGHVGGQSRVARLEHDPDDATASRSDDLQVLFHFLDRVWTADTGIEGASTVRRNRSHRLELLRYSGRSSRWSFLTTCSINASCWRISACVCT